jgi:hypothetical protein
MKMEIYYQFHPSIIKDRETYRFTSMDIKEVGLKIVNPFNQISSRALIIIRACYLNLKRENGIN